MRRLHQKVNIIPVIGDLIFYMMNCVQLNLKREQDKKMNERSDCCQISYLNKQCVDIGLTDN